MGKNRGKKKGSGQTSQQEGDTRGQGSGTGQQPQGSQPQHPQPGGFTQAGPPQQPGPPGGAWQTGPPQQPGPPGGAWQTGPPQQQAQPQNPWHRGPPPQQPVPPGGARQTGPPQQQQPQAGTPWQRGPPQFQQHSQPVGQFQPQQQDTQAGGDWQRGPPQQQQQPQPGSGWQRGPPQQQQQPQPGNAWQRGPPQQQQQPQAGTPWQRGPPQFQQQHSQPVGQFQPQQQDTQAGGDWQRGPPQQRQQQPPQPGSGWQRGPPQQQQQSQSGSAWQRGPPQQQQSQSGSAWQRGPPQQQQQQPQAGTPWQRGPPQFQQQQHSQPVGQFQPQQRDPQAGGDWQKKHPSSPAHAGGDRMKQPGDSPQKQRLRRESPQGEKSEGKQGPREGVSTLEFAPRIYAEKKSGRAITVFANFFRLNILNPNITVYHYDVVFEPDKPKYLLRDVWNTYVSMVFPGRLTAFDGKNAYSKGPLSDSTEATTVKVTNPEREGVDKEFRVSIHLVQKVNFSCFQNYRERMLQSRSMKVLPEREISVLDIILRNSPSNNSVRCGKSFFPFSRELRSQTNLSERLTLRLGYFQSAFLGYVPFLNFDISHKVFYQTAQLSDLAETFRNRYTGNVDVEEMSRFLRTVKVEYQVPNGKDLKRTFRVNKLMGNAKDQTFKKEDGSQTSVAQYFATEKRCPLRRPDLPVLWVGSQQKTIYVPMEFCSIVPDQVYKMMLDPREQREMVREATSDARRRKADVYKLLEKRGLCNDPLLKEFELEVSQKMEQVPARVLDPPLLKTSRTVRVKDGVFNVQDFLEPVTLDKWCFLILDKKVRRESVLKLQNMLKAKGNSFNMRISDPARDPIEGDHSAPALRRIFSQLKGMKLVFVVISEAKGVYGKVKAICETQEGILTQCIKGGTVGQQEGRLVSTVQNLLLKVNAKLGGKNYGLEGNSAPPCLKGKVMVVGADVTHPSPGLKIPSVAAVTVSCDPEAFQYATTTRVQPKGEMIRDMQDIISIHLKKFYELRKGYPEKIIFFRDGVSEGELEKVFKGELAAVRNACGGLCNPKITFIVVQKRHHTRFFPTSPSDEVGRNFNVPVGTCVDSVIVHPRDLDFYLVSHASILGTARSTRYRLLHDDNRLTDQEVQVLSYYLCHLYSRCTRSVSYPSPTYNAHLAAARIRAHMEGLDLTGDKDIDFIKEKLKDTISNNYPMFFV